MKKTNVKHFLIAAFSAIIFVSLVVSCNKRDDFHTQNAVSEGINSEKLELKIVQFQSQLEYYRSHPNVKSGELMSIEEAIWNLETFFNVSYAYPEFGLASNQIDTLVFGLPSTSGNVDVGDVVTLYDEIVQEIAKLYHNNPLEDKKYFILNINQGAVTATTTELILYSVIGQERGIQPSDPGTSLQNLFENQYWKYGDLLGTCSGQQLGSDAAIKLDEALNLFNERRKNYPVPNTGRYVFIDLETIDVSGDAYQNQNGNHLMFYIEKSIGVPFTDGEKCLDPDELNFHYLGLQQVVYNRIPDDYSFASNRMLVSAGISGTKRDINDDSNSPYHCLIHDGLFTYGNRVNIINLPDEREELPNLD
ncbi:MAG: hypothetical protein LBM67_02565 [Lentimicrobiaceae bacterium]|nr:hypothetical protein [Lentimicrobiaceae bacterium]